jgi:hypothetical protein
MLSFEGLIALDQGRHRQDDLPTAVTPECRNAIMTATKRIVCDGVVDVAIMFTIAFSAAPIGAQQEKPSPAPAVQRASFDRPSSRQSGTFVTFGEYTAKVGDHVEQSISLGMRLATSFRQGAQLVAKNQTIMQSEQRRVITTTHVESGRATGVIVCYHKATKHVTASDGPTTLNSAAAAAPIAHPVAGKTYCCRREGGEDSKLTVTDLKGNLPPLAELEIVSRHMDIVGRANPLSTLLAGRAVAIGETLELPQAAAERLFNLSERFGNVQRFNLTLRETAICDGRPCAVFLARVEAASTGSEQMRLQVEGPLVVQIDTCRAVRVELSGPMGFSESRGSYSTAHQLIGTGQLNMSTANVYGAAAQ